MSVVTLVVIIVVGLAVGLLSGLVGIGGGVLIVPFLYFFYDRPDLFGVVVSPEARVVLAHGTSLFVITPTAFRGAFAYNRSKLVEWRAVWPIGAASIVAAFLGARLAVLLPPEALKTGFGALLVFAGTRLAYRRGSEAALTELAEPRLSLSRTLVAGALIGIFSALLGVGGGTVGIPLLIYLLKLDIRQVAATSIGIIGLTAAAGSIGYMITGYGAPGLPPWSVGYVHVSAGIAMFLGALLSVRWGTALNQRMKPRTLEVVFGLLFVLIGLRLAGANLIALVASAVGS
jgi:uncharacterized membrane protein YfcA